MKIFQCEMLTTADTVEKSCDGIDYPECYFCTRNINTRRQINEKKRKRIANEPVKGKRLE